MVDPIAALTSHVQKAMVAALGDEFANAEAEVPVPAPVLAAIKSLDAGILLLFMAGCVVGLLSIARLITWAFHHFHDLVLGLLTGFMIGALNKVWPWKETLSWRTNSSGEQVPLNETSIWPSTFAEQAGQDPQVLFALLMAAAGFALVLLVEWLGSRHGEVAPSR